MIVSLPGRASAMALDEGAGTLRLALRAAQKQIIVRLVIAMYTGIACGIHAGFAVQRLHCQAALSSAMVGQTRGLT